jgi:hypothetical protein
VWGQESASFPTGVSFAVSDVAGVANNDDDGLDESRLVPTGSIRCGIVLLDLRQGHSAKVTRSQN